LTDKGARIELTSINRVLNVPIEGVELQHNIENFKTRSFGGDGKTPFAPRATHAYMESPAFSMVSPGYNADNMASPSYYSKLK